MNFDFVILTTFWGYSLTIKHLIGCAALLVLTFPLVFFSGCVFRNDDKCGIIKTYLIGVANIILLLAVFAAFVGLVWLINWAFIS